MLKMKNIKVAFMSMWFKKQPEADRAWEEQTRYLADFKSIGARVSYLGVDCVVVRHHECRGFNGWHPSLCIQYVNADGVFAEHILAVELIGPLRTSGVLK